MTIVTREEISQEAQTQIKKLLEENDGSVTGVANELGVNKGLVSRVASGGYSATVNIALGLPVLSVVEMPVCLTCGQVHEIKKTCNNTRSNRKYRRRKAADLNDGHWGKIQSQALDGLAAEAGFGSWSEFVCDLANQAVNLLGNQWLSERLDELMGELNVPDKFHLPVNIDTKNSLRQEVVNSLEFVRAPTESELTLVQEAISLALS